MLRELGEKAGISAAMLSEIEHAKKEGSVRTPSALAGALGLDLDDLVPWNRSLASGSDLIGWERK